MKRVVDGVAYNTATATRIAVTHYDHEADQFDPAAHGTITLYQTRGGALFTVDDGEKSVWIARENEHEQRSLVVFSAKSADQAREMLKRGEWEIIDTNFAAFPEAEAEPKDDKPATLYVRMPASLKTRIDGAAQDEGVSANVMAMRCLEKCLAESVTSPKELWERQAEGDVWVSDNVMERWDNHTSALTAGIITKADVVSAVCKDESLMRWLGVEKLIFAAIDEKLAYYAEAAPQNSVPSVPHPAFTA